MMNPLTYFKNLYENLFNKKEEEDDIPDSWKTQETIGSMEIPEIPEETENPSKLGKIRTMVPHFPKPSKKIFIPSLAKGKRILAFVLMILNFIVGLLNINPATLIFYIFTALILLDYLFKTRPKKEDVEWWVIPKMEEE